MSTQASAVTDSQHLVQFYGRDEELAASVAGYLADALVAGGAAVVVATLAHRRAIETELSRAGVDVSADRVSGRLVCLDAAETLASFTVAGKIDPQSFQLTIGEVIRRAAAQGEPLHAFGEMVSLLWEDGDVLAAIELEELWNSLQEESRFSLMCAYRQSEVTGPEHRQSLERICQLHSAVHNAPAVEASPRSPAAVELTAQFAPEAQAPGAARRLLSDALDRAGQTDPVLSQDAQLLISELVTNAVLHAQSQISVVVRCKDSSVRLWVRDFSLGQPVMRTHSHRLGLGVGLQLVDSIASDWGVEAHDQGKAVWAELHA